MDRTTGDFVSNPNHLRGWLARLNARLVAPGPIKKTQRPKRQRKWIPQGELSYFPKSVNPERDNKPVSPSQNKLERISETFIDNDQSRLAFARLNLMLRKRQRRDYRILIFTGEPRTGKTRILTEFVCDHPPIREATLYGRRTRWPTLYLTGVPGPATVKGLCCAIFSQLGLTIQSQHSISRTVETTIDLIRALGVYMLVIDEAQVFYRATAPEVRRIGDFMRRLIRDKVCQVVLSGTPRLKNFDRHFRFVPKSYFRLRNFLDEEPERFEPLLGAICSHLPLPCVIRPDDTELLHLIASSGAVGSIIGLFKSASIRALSAGATRIERQHFRDARDDFGRADEADFDEFDGIPNSLDEPADERNSVVGVPMVLRKTIGDYRKVRTSPLPISLDPKPGESIRGFLARLAQANYLLGIKTLLKLYGVSYFENSTHDSQSWVSIAATAAEIPSTVLVPSARLITKPDAQGRKNKFLGAFLGKGAFRASFCWCPRCLQEGLFHRDIWQLDDLTVCVRHGVYLETCCPRCGCEPGFRSPIGKCPESCFGWRCGTQLGSVPPRRARAEDIKAGSNLLQKFMSQ